MLRNKGYAFFLDAMLAIALFILILNFISVDEVTPQKFKFFKYLNINPFFDPCLFLFVFVWLNEEMTVTKMVTIWLQF